MKARIIFLYISFAVSALLVLVTAQVFAQLSAGPHLNQSDLGFGRVDINEIISTTYLRDSTYVYAVQDEDSDEWVLQERAIYDYDNQGREFLRNVMSISDLGWCNKQQVKSSYLDDFLSSTEELIWSEENSNWKSDKKSDFTYNYVGLVDEITNSTFTNSMWTTTSKTSYTYNSNYNISVEASFDWDPISSEWAPVSRFLFTYNLNKDIKKEVYQTWNDSLMIWTNSTSKIYDYNSDQKLISTIRRSWDTEDAAWLETGIVVIKYNDNGQISGSQQESINKDKEYTPTQFEQPNYDSDGNIGQIVRSEWDAETESWSIYQKHVHFWAEYSHGNLDKNQNEIDCFFANPYTIGLPLYCESLKADVIYTVSLYDINGRFFYSGKFLGSSSFRINEYIEPGYYIFQITGGLDSHSEKIFIKN